MTLEELKHKAITTALQRHNNNAEKAAWELKVSARSVYTFKAEQEIKEDKYKTIEEDKIVENWIEEQRRKQKRKQIIKQLKNK